MSEIALVMPLHSESARLLHGFMVLYVGPDQILPFTSALGAILGVVMIFWRRLAGLVRHAWRGLFARREERVEPTTPER